MMHRNYAIAALLTLLLILWVWIAIKGPTQTYRMSTVSQTLKTTESLILLKKVVQERIATIKRESGLLTPYNSRAMSFVSAAVDRATSLNELGAAFLLLPNNSIGSAPLGPIWKTRGHDSFSVRTRTSRLVLGICDLQKPTYQS